MEGRPAELIGLPGGPIVRLARPDQVDTLAEIEAAAGEMFRDVGLDAIADDEEPAPETYLAAIADRTIWVAEVDGRAVGYAWAVDLGLPGRPRPHLEQLSVRPEHGGCGIGTALVDATLHWARHRGGSDLTLTTFRDVWFNRPWYERRGFQVVPDDQLSDELRAVRAHEAELGIDLAPRVAMRRAVPGT